MSEEEFFKLIVPYINPNKIFSKFTISNIEFTFFILDTRISTNGAPHDSDTSLDYRIEKDLIICNNSNLVINKHFSFCYNPDPTKNYYLFESGYHYNYNVQFNRFDDFTNKEVYTTIINRLRDYKITQFLL